MGESNTTSALMHLDTDVEKVRDEESCKCCTNKKLLFTLAILLVVAGATVCMETIYILQRERNQNNINEFVLNKMEELESITSACPCQTDGEAARMVDPKASVHQGMSLKYPSRAKRQILSPPTEDDLNETQHIKNEHHGIASSHIALMYADPQILNRSSISEPEHSLLKFRNSSEVEPTCGKVMENGNEDLWCIPRFPNKQKHRIMLQGKKAYYPYFAQASWMRGENAESNFEVMRDEQMSLVVKKPGIYIVTSSMHFEQVTTGMIHYGVYARDRLNSIDSERLLGVCASTVNPGEEQGSLYPCSTWQLAPLKKGDRVFFRINPFAWIRVQKESFFLALIKLNDWEL